MGIINQVITILESGDWYDFEDLNDYFFMPNSQIKSVIDFLFDYDFLEKNYLTGKFRLTSKLVSLIGLKK